MLSLQEMKARQKRRGLCFIFLLQLLGLKAVAGQHLHAGETSCLDGGGGFLKAEGQAVNVVGVRGDDDLAAHLLPLTQQPCAGVEVLAVAAVNAAGVHFQQAVVVLCGLQSLESSSLVAGRLLVEERQG